VIGEADGKGEGLLDRVGAVGVDKQRRLADRRLRDRYASRIVARISPTFIFTNLQPSSDTQHPSWLLSSSSE
jgi:hypothetical protein